MSFPPALDHLLIGAPDLAAGVAWIAERYGVTPSPGGRHPGLGTHNALLGLGDGRYLEVIAPDPAGAGLAPPFAWLADLSEPRLATWAARADDLAPIASALDRLDRRHSDILPGSRRRPDGSLLEWWTLFPDETEGGVVPFFIRWKNPEEHPARSLAPALELESLAFVHPRAERVGKVFETVGLDGRIERGEPPRLVATFRR